MTTHEPMVTVANADSVLSHELRLFVDQCGTFKIQFASHAERYETTQARTGIFKFAEQICQVEIVIHKRDAWIYEA